MPNVKAGRYQLQQELGRGAMGVVWKAYDPTIGRTVAVKAMKLTEEDSGLNRPELITRFQNETRAAGLLSHPNIVVIYDAGEDEGTFYITMEYVEGRSLLSVIERKQAFPITRVIKVMEQACAALEYAHQRSVVHRDVKPANILLTPDDTVKITDFGTAKIIQMGTTQTGQVIGTPSYMSPEQIKGKPVDGRTDVFSLGVILYELVTGEKPFPGQNVTTVIYKIVHEDPIAPRELDSSVHPGLNHVITKALEKDPAKRYQSCRALIEDLKNYRHLGGEPDLAATVVMMGRGHAPPVPPVSTTGTVIAAPVPPIPVPPPRPPAAAGPAEPVLPTPPPAKAPPPPTAAPRPAEAAPPKAAAPAPIPSGPAPRPIALEVPEKKRSGTIWLALVSLAIIVGGGYLLWPTLSERLNLRPATESTAPATSTGPSEATGAKESAQPVESKPGKKTAEKASAEAAAAKKKEEAAAASKPKAEAPRAAKADPAVFKAQIEGKLALAGVGDKVRVEVSGNTLTLVGALSPNERRKLTRLMRGTGGLKGGEGLKLLDRIQLARATPGEAEDKPHTAPGMGEIEVVTDVLGATAAITGPGGSPSADCRTPCRFEELPPGRYTMEVTLAGYRPLKRILNVRAGSIVEETLQLQALASGIVLSSKPDHATVFINGQRHSEATPTTMMLSPGTYAVALEKPGYERHEVNVQLRSDELKRISVELTEQRSVGPPPAPAAAPAAARRGSGWLDVRSVPPGADILIGNTNTGRRTPTRIELPAGEYTLVIYLKGYQAVRKTIVIQEGQSVTIAEVLPR